MRLSIHLLTIWLVFGLPSPTSHGTRVSAQAVEGIATAAVLPGAWETSYEESDGRPAKLMMIVSPTHLSMASYYTDDGAFIATLGGSWEAENDEFLLTYEFDSATPEQVGGKATIPYEITNGFLVFNGSKFWRRVDTADEAPLAGAWEITGRKRDGAMQDMSSRRDGPRKTMKILSGTRFQWIAFNTETGEFSGTGGGTYATNRSGEYVETIEFFSRDDSRVGAELSFDYAIRNGDWVHKGKSSKGAPIHEVWSVRR